MNLFVRWKKLLHFQHFRSLQVADFSGNFVNGPGKNGKGCKELRMTVALNHLAGNRSRFQAQLGTDVFFNVRVDTGEGANCTRDLAISNALPSPFEPVNIAFDFFIPIGNFQSKGQRLGMNTMRPANDRGEFVFLRLPFQYMLKN